MMFWTIWCTERANLTIFPPFAQPTRGLLCCAIFPTFFPRTRNLGKNFPRTRNRRHKNEKTKAKVLFSAQKDWGEVPGRAICRGSPCKMAAKIRIDLWNYYWSKRILFQHDFSSFRQFFVSVNDVLSWKSILITTNLKNANVWRLSVHSMIEDSKWSWQMTIRFKL